MILPIAIVIYYGIKSFIIFKENQLQYRNNLSDVKEIVKDTEKRSYIDEESSKTYRAKAKEEEEIKKVIISEQKIRRSNKNGKNQKGSHSK